MALIQGTDGPENLHGTEFDDTIIGKKGDDLLFGLGGNDLFQFYAGHGQGSSAPIDAAPAGGDGADSIDGGSGSDTFEVTGDWLNYLYVLGGHIFDTMRYSLNAGNGGSAVFTRSATETFPINNGASQQASIQQSSVVLVSVENFSFLGTHIDNPSPHAVDDRFVVGDLSSTGMTGQVFLDGGIGNDLFQSTGPTPIFAVGGDGNDSLIGGSGNDTLDGQEGNDTLFAGGGANLLRGGQGFDELYGGSGSDILDGGVDNDILHAGNGGNILLGGEGHDSLYGGAGGDSLYGQDGNDTITAGSGVQTLLGGLGDDIYFSDNPSNTIFEQANEGYDTVYTRANALMLAPNIEKLVFIGSGNFIGAGSDGDNWIQGGNGNDYLIGFGGNDLLYGAGGYGNSLQGGTGDDTYIVDNPGDTLVESANEGHDLVVVMLASFTLAQNLEDLRHVGTSAFTGTGNQLDNVIWGTIGNDHLIGLGGNDTLDDGGDGINLLEGGAGDDRYIVASSADTIVELAGQGHDTVETSLATFALPDNVEDLTTTGNNVSFAGNELNNVIRLLGGSGGSVDGRAGDDTLIGGAGNDVLSGGYGNDTLNGGLGSDELAGGGGADHFVFATTAGPGDLIHDFSHAEGDKIDVSQIMNALGPIGDDPFGNGVLTIQPMAFGGGTATQVLLDLDGSAGPGSATTLFLALGGGAVVNQSDLIIT
jgi:serralysin